MSEENLDKIAFVSIHYIICECGETFPSEEALKIHLELEHPHKRERKEYKCGICSKVYNSENDCILHYETTHMPVPIHPDNYEAEDEDFKEDKKLKLEPEDVYHDEEMPAVEVILENTNKHEAFQEDHVGALIQQTEGKVPIPNKLVIPPARKRGRKVIPRTHTDPEILFVIQDGENKGEQVPMLKKSGRRPKGQKYIVCEICGKHYASNAALRYHQRHHTGERPYRCELCPKAFTMPLFLQIHTRTHTGERPFQCNECPKAFSNKAALLRHDRVHTGEKPYKCPMCAKGFTQSNSMKLHVTTVHLKQPTPYKSKNRQKLSVERSQARQKVFINPRKKIPAKVDSIEVLRNGLESYVLGPLKTDLEHLKADIDMLAQGKFDEPTTEENEDEYKLKESVVYEMKDNNMYEIIEEVLYENGDNHETYEVVCGDGE